MKYLLSFTLAIISITQFFGQEDFIQKGITIEPFVGYSQSTFIDGDIPESAYLRTYTVGVIGNYFANKTWSIRTGIIKDRMGGSLFGLKYNTPNGTLNVYDFECQCTVFINLNFAKSPTPSKSKLTRLNAGQVKELNKYMSAIFIK